MCCTVVGIVFILFIGIAFDAHSIGRARRMREERAVEEANLTEDQRRWRKIMDEDDGEL